MSGRGKTLIIFAWAMEAVGVASGVVNSTYTTFGEHLPTTWIECVPALPLLILAVAEFGRVPLASVIFNKHKFMQGVAMLGILALGYLAVENWTFGFDRVVELRLRAVTAAKAELSRAEADLSALLEQRQESTNGDRQKRDELRRALDKRDVSIAQLNPQLAEEAEVHRKNLEGIREACRIIRDKCMVPRSHAEDLRYEKEVNQLSATLARLRDERNQLQSQVDESVSKDRAGVASVSKKISAAQASVNEARQEVQNAVDRNQIYRLAASWYGVSASEVTPKQFATARLVFTTFGAIAVAFAGSLAALVYYGRDRLPGPSRVEMLRTKIARARRAYYARKRKPIVREVPGPERIVYRDGKEPPVVVEKEVPRFIDQIVVIPWGIKAPFHVNRLIRNHRNGGVRGDNPTNPPSNVMPLNKKAS